MGSGAARPDHSTPFRRVLTATAIVAAVLLAGPSPAQTHATLAAASGAGVWPLVAPNKLGRTFGDLPPNASGDAPVAFGPRTQKSFPTPFGRLPLFFIENRGQLDSRVSHYIQGRDKTVYFSPEGLSIALLAGEASAGRWVVKLDFEGTNGAAGATGERRTPARVSYFKGRQAEQITGLSTYGALIYHNLWPGIDLEYAGEVNRLKYAVFVKPGADPSRIRFRYRGADVRMAATGEVVVETPFGSFRDTQPVAYQEADGERVPVTARFAFESDGTFGFELGAYDVTRPLVIDPSIVIYSGFVGGAGIDGAAGIALDAAGAAYVVGETASAAGSFPAAAGPDLSFNGGNRDAFVAKVSADGTALLYAGYLGGAGDDIGTGIAVDSEGNAYVTGETSSSETSFPVHGGPDLSYNGGRDAFVAKVNASGTALVYAGYIGGSNIDTGRGIAVDSGGNAYVVGDTFSSEATFPARTGPDLTFNGARDGFVAKVNASGSGLLYAGYIGGDRSDIGRAIALGADGSAYIAGDTASGEASFPVAGGPDLTYNGGLNDAFVAKVTPSGGGLEFAGYIGGSQTDTANAIAVSAAGEAYVAGETASTETTFPVLRGPGLAYGGGVRDAFAAKISAGGTALVYAGYIGGAGTDTANGVALDSGGNLYIAGSTGSAEDTFPASSGPDVTFNGVRDAFAAKVNPSGSSLLFASYFGGSADDAGNAIAVAPAGDAYLAGTTSSSAASFAVSAGPDLTANGASDAFVARFTVEVGPITSEGIVNAASYLRGPIAPGEIISIFGIMLGPQEPVLAELQDDGRLATQIGGTEVLFDGVPGAMFYASEGQLNVQVPYSVAGATSVAVKVIHDGQETNAVRVDVAPSAPGLFTADASGSGQVIAVDVNGNLNSAEHPVGAGDVIVLYATGEGQTVPPGVMGKLAEAPYPKPVLPVRLLIGGMEAQLLYAGAAPGFAGLMQLNAIVPEGLAAAALSETGPRGVGQSRDGIPVVLIVGDEESQPGATIDIGEGGSGVGIPTANPQSLMTDEDTPLNLTLTGSDPEGGALTFAILGGPSHGKLTLGAAGAASLAATYTPNKDYNGPDSFVFQVTDPENNKASAVVRITVKPVNDAPEAVDDTASTRSGRDVSIPVLANDRDPDGDPLRIASVGNPPNGTAVIDIANQRIIYTSDSGFTGVDSFPYTATDGTLSDSAIVRVTVREPANGPPVAHPQNVVTKERTPVVITLSGTDPDGDPLTFSIESGPANGSLGAVTPVGAETAQVTYTPDTGFFGSDSFTFKVTDPDGETDTAVVHITVNRTVSDLAITKTPATANVTAGGQAVYTLIVVNNGPDEASDVVVTDTFPASLSHVSNTCAAMVGAGSVTWPVGTLANGAMAACQVTFNVSPAATANVVNQASVAAHELDPNSGNNLAATNNPIAFDVTLSVTKSLPGPFRVGMTADYMVRVDHVAGVSYANNVQVTDVLDSRLSFVSAGSSAGCSALGQTVTCNAAAPVAPGGNVSFTIRVMVGGAP